MTEAERLKKLALEAFAKDISERLVIDVSKVPKEFGRGLWQHLSKCAIIRTALNSDAVDWFSQNVIEQPTNMDFSFTDIYLAHVSLHFNRRESVFDWIFEERDDEDKDSPFDMFDIKIGEHVLPTRIDSSGREGVQQMISKIASDLKIRIDVIDWLRKFFKCNISVFQLDTSECCQYWDLSKESGKVSLYECMDVDFVKRVVPERRQKGWYTRIYMLRIDEPTSISLEQIKQAGIKIVHLNLTGSTFDTIVSFHQGMISENHSISTKVSDWTVEQLKKFKDALGFTDYSEELERTHVWKNGFMENSERRMCKMIEGGHALVVLVNEKDLEPGVYDRIGCTFWNKIPPQWI